MTERIVLNEAPTLDLHVHKGEDLRLMVSWWSDQEETVPIDILAIEGAVKATLEDEDSLVDLSDYADIADNAASIVVPMADLADLPLGDGVWSLTLVGAGDERKLVGRGVARIFEDAGV